MHAWKDGSKSIAVWRHGQLCPIFPSAPLFSSGALWPGVLLERHRVSLPEAECSVVGGGLLCCNLGRPAPVTWNIDGRRQTILTSQRGLTFTAHGEARDVSWDQPMELLLLSLAPGVLVNEDSGLAPEMAGKRGFRDRQIEALLGMLHSDALAGSPAGSMFGEQLATALAGYLARRFSVRQQARGACRSKLPGTVLRRIFDLMEARLCEHLSLPELACEAQVSRFYFARLFRNSTGVSPARYLLLRRLEKAKHLLDVSQMSLIEIAGATGFSSHSHLSAAFRQKLGLTPSAYRHFSGRMRQDQTNAAV